MSTGTMTVAVGDARSNRAQGHKRRSSSTSSASSTSSTASNRTQYALVLILQPLNNTFERKTLVVPFAPQVLKLGRQTNAKTVPTLENGYFDSRVLSRQHAEVWADAHGKLWIKDTKSSNGTYINSERLSEDNSESIPHELKKNDILELGIDITNDDGTTLMHRKISAQVERISVMSLLANTTDTNTMNGTANTTMTSTTTNNNNQKPLPRINTNTKRSLGGYGTSQPDSLDVALFGDVDASLEDLVMSHAKNSLGGMFVSSGIATSAYETAVKKLIGEIHAAKVEGAKIKSVSALLEQIQKSQRKKPVLNQLVEQVTKKDVYIKQLEGRIEEREREETLSEDMERRLNDAQTDLAEARCQVDIFKSRAQAAEDMAMKSSKTIAELVAALEESKQQQHEQQHEHDQNKEETNKPEEWVDQQVHQQRMAASVLPATTALGVVLMGIGVMQIINSYTRD